MTRISKALSLMSISICLVTVSALPAQAQIKINRKVTAKPAANNKVDPALAQAAKLTNQANNQLQRGLPIYDGHRVLAIQITELALHDMRMAYRQDRKATPQQSARSQVQGLGNPKEVSKKQYSAKEIAHSNQLLISARGNLVQARAELGNSRVDEAYRSHAAELIHYAIQEIDAALAFVNAR